MSSSPKPGHSELPPNEDLFAVSEAYVRTHSILYNPAVLDQPRADAAICQMVRTKVEATSLFGRPGTRSIASGIALSGDSYFSVTLQDEHARRSPTAHGRYLGQVSLWFNRHQPVAQAKNNWTFSAWYDLHELAGQTTLHVTEELFRPFQPASADSPSQPAHRGVVNHQPVAQGTVTALLKLVKQYQNYDATVNAARTGRSFHYKPRVPKS